MATMVPDNYAFESYETLQYQFDDVSDVTPTGSSGTVEDNTVYVKTGTGSIAVTPDAGGARSFHKDENFYIVSGLVGVWIYIEDWEKVTNIILYLGHDTGFVDGFTYTYVPLHNGWHFLQLNKQDFTTTGSGDWETQFVRWRFRTTVDAGVTTSVYYDSLWHGGGRARGKVILSFDDSVESQYDTARPILNTAGLKANFNVIYTSLGSGVFLTLAEVQTLKDDGHAICVHGLTDLTSLSIADATSDVAANIAGVSTIDPEGAKHYVYPNGRFEYSSGDTQIVNMLSSLGIVTARSTDRSPKVTSTVKGVDTPLILGINGYVNTVDTMDEMYSAVDSAYQSGCTIIIMLHKVVTTAVDSTDISTANFQLLVDHIKKRVLERRIDVVTMPEWWNGLSASRKFRP